jgi:hypothetical protein
VIAHGNIRYRVVSVIPDALAAEFVDEPLNGVLEVEPPLKSTVRFGLGD